MSYIINNTGGFINLKLTDTGRRKLAEGRLNFTAWGIGDSEINYNREEIVDDFQNDPQLSGYSKVLRPVDMQPNISSYVTIDGATPTNPLNASQIQTIKAIVNNKAIERGFFNGTTGQTYETLMTEQYIVTSGCIPNINISGGTTLNFGTTGVTYNEGDFILLKPTNDSSGNIPVNNNDSAIPNIWYKIQASGTTSVELDRLLPNLSNFSGDTCYIIYPQGEVHEAFGETSTMPYWNTNTLSFDNCCYTSCGDVPVWNMNNIWCENIIGMTGSGINNVVSTPNESYEKFGSWAYLGQKYPFLNYICSEAIDVEVDVCDVPGQSIIDSVRKSISILHYTNNTISNYYGEFLFIDSTNNKNLTVTIPTIMYHRRDFVTGSGTTMGMTFISNGEIKLISGTDIEYVDLIEDSQLINGTPKVVGKVFPQLKIVVIDDDEIVAAISYKSNRNWTLPPLTANLSAPTGGLSSGILQPNEVMWLTYTLENNSMSGLTSSLPCQYYTIMANNTSGPKDVQFKISDVDLLPYMRKVESPNYDGLGFYATDFKVLYQILPSDERPTSDGWLEHNYTTSGLTTNLGETIDPEILENQNPNALGFVLDIPTTSGDTIFSIMDTLNMPTNSNPNLLQFGDERFFYGNIDTYIGASIYKTIFSLNISADLFKFTTNPTRDTDLTTNPPNLKITECGIYDSSGDLVMIGKFSRPVKLTPGNSVLLEFSMDF
jgi:hypothetical protein